MGVVQPVPMKSIQLQRQAELQNYLQFPSRDVKIHVVNSIESIEHAAEVLGVSLTEWSSTASHVHNPFAEVAAVTSKLSADSEEELKLKDMETEFLHGFLRRRFPPGRQEIWPLAAQSDSVPPPPPLQQQQKQQQQQQQQQGLSRSLGYRNIVGLDSEWRVVMYAANYDRAGCSILQVHNNLQNMYI